MELVPRPEVRDATPVSGDLMIGGQRVVPTRLGIEPHEAAYLLELSVRAVLRMCYHEELREACVGLDRPIDPASLVIVVERLVRDGELDPMSLVLLRELVTDKRYIPRSVVDARPRHRLRG